MKKAKSKAVTLIEILIVMSLIGIAIGTMQFGIHAFLKEEAFVQESNKIRNAIGLTQEIMMDTKSDLNLTLVHEENSVKLLFTSSKPLPKRLTRSLSNICCKEIAFLSFNGKELPELTLHFEGHLGRVSKGIILLKNKKGKEQAIFLHGFPGRLTP